MTPRGAAVVAALTVAVALGCWWMLNSASIDEPAPAPADVAPSRPRPTIRRRHALAATTGALKPAESAAPGTAHLLVHVTADETGEPIAGADVYVADRRDKEHAAKTDAAGAARFRALPAGTVQVLAEAPGFARRIYPFVVVWEEAEAESLFELERGTAVTGVVLDETGRPLAGASAMATDARDDWLDDWMTPIAETTTARDGTFRLEGVSAESPSFLQFTAPKYSVTTIAWHSATDGRVEARLVRAGRLEGRVREPSGRPAVEAHVKARSSAPDQPERWETTDAEGRFVVEKLPVGVAWTVRAEKDGFIDSAPLDVVVRDGDAGASCDLRLRKRPRLEFLVLDGAGAPVDVAEVDVKDASGRFEPRQCVKGRATFDVAEAGACRVTIDAPRFVPHEETVEAAVDETKQVVVRMDAGATLAGVVVDDAGTPVAGAAIEVVGGTLAGFGKWTRLATSGADGGFRIEGLTAGAHAMEVAAEGRETWHDAATAPSGAMRVVLPRFARVTIRLRAPAGGPTPGDVGVSVVSRDTAKVGDEKSMQAVAVLVEKSPTPWRGSSWSDSFDVPAGRWTVGVDVRGFIPEIRDFDVAAGDEAVLDEIVLDRGRSIAGVVVDDVGKPVPNARVETRPHLDSGETHGWGSVESEADGSFRFDAIARTVAAVDVRAHVRGGDETEAWNVAVPSDSLRLVIRRNGNVAFRVRGKSDQPLASLEIRVDNFGVDDVPESGDVRLSLVPGARTILVRAARHAPTEFTVDVAPGCELRPPDVVLDAGASLAGRVVDAAGRPVVGATIEAQVEQAKSDDDGRFVVEHLVRRDTTVRVVANGFRDSYADWTRASPDPLVVAMRRGGLVRGRVHDVAGAPVCDVYVMVVDPGRPETCKEDEPSVGRDGSFASRLPEGRWRIEISRDGKQLVTRDVELAEGDEKTVDISVAK